MVQVGKPAPDFTLKTSDNQEVSLKDFQGKNLVLFFFPKAFTSVCTDQMCYARDNMDDYNGMNAEVLGVSVDEVDELAKFKAENNLNFSLASDADKKVSGVYTGLYESTGKAKRSAFVIDGEGVVQYAEVLENPLNQPNFEAVSSTLANMNG